MSKRTTQKQIEANRRNAQKSTGPKTPQGVAQSKMNALKHGILSREVLVHGRNINESSREFTALHQRFTQSLNPVGPLEEMLVDQIVTAHWRLRRALAAEAGEIALSVDSGQWQRQTVSLRQKAMLWALEDDPTFAMRNSYVGNRFMENQLKAVRDSVEADGELTESAIQSVILFGKPYSLTKDLDELRLRLQQNPDGLDPQAFRAKQKEQALAHLDRKLGRISFQKSECEEREKTEEGSRQAGAVLQSMEVLEKIQRYETKLERQLFRAMAQLERLQRMRQGESVPAPLSLDVAGRND